MLNYEKKVIAIWITIILVGSVGGVLYRHFHFIDKQTASIPSTHEVQIHQNFIEPKTIKSDDIKPKVSLRARLALETDFASLAKQALPQAQQGNVEAQYVIYKSYRDCTYRRTIEACVGFTADAIKELDPWTQLQKATDAGYPIAQAMTAKEHMIQQKRRLQVMAGFTVDDPVTDLPPIGGDIKPRELLIQAISGNDPEVFILVANMQSSLHEPEDHENIKIDSAAWTAIACQKGMNCYGTGSSKAPEWVMQSLNYNWTPVQERIDQINASIAAQQWDKIPGINYLR